MPERVQAKSIGARDARKLLREVGGSPAPELLAELKRVLGYADDTEIYRLTDGRVVDIFYGSGRVFASVEEYRRLQALVEEAASRKLQHPLGSAFPNGDGFIDAVPRLVQELSGKLRIGTRVLTGSVDSLEYIDKAARRIGGQNCLDDSNMLASIVAYVGEVVRQPTAGRWEIRGWDFSGSEESEQWEPVIVGGDGQVFHPFAVFEQLLERGSIWAWAEVSLGGMGRARREEEIRSPARGALGEVPEDAYRVTRRHGDGQPWIVSFHRDTWVGGFPFRAGTEAYFGKSGEPSGGTLSQAHSFGALRFGPGTEVHYGKGPKGVRVNNAVLAKDQLIDGLPCRAGEAVMFHRSQRISGATLATDREIDGIPCAGGRFVSLHGNGNLSEAVLAEEHILNGRRLPRRTWLSFNAKVRLVSMCLQQNWDIDGVPAKAETVVEFHSNGRLSRVTLARSHSIASQTYMEGTLLHFDASGQLTYAWPNMTPPR